MHFENPYFDPTQFGRAPKLGTDAIRANKYDLV
jgi:hypothetical protein